MEAEIKQLKKEIEATKKYQRGSHVFQDIESGEIVTLDQLYREFIEMRAAQPDEYNYSFTHYLYNSLTVNNGTLEELEQSPVILKVSAFE